MSERPTRKDMETSTRRWMWAGLILMALFISVFPIYKIYEPAQRAEARESQGAFLAAAGADLYELECSSCHGPHGVGALAPAIGSKNFLESVDNTQLFHLIALGVPGTEMVSYSSDYGGSMTSTEIESIAAYLRSLEEDAEPNSIWRTPLANDNLTGEDLFGLACAQCHGRDRMGIEDVGPDISSTSLTMDESDEFLFGRIHDGRKEMPRFGGVLTDEQILALVLYLRDGIVTSTTTTTTVSGDTPSVPSGPSPDDVALLALGKEIFDVSAGGEGCAACHGFDGQGSKDGPNIIGSSKAAIKGALGGGNLDMEDVKLDAKQLAAVYLYLSTLQP